MKYKVNVGVNYRPTPQSAEKRAEPGDVVDDVPAKSAKWLLADGVLAPIEGEDK